MTFLVDFIDLPKSNLTFSLPSQLICYSKGKSFHLDDVIFTNSTMSQFYETQSLKLYK